MNVPNINPASLSLEEFQRFAETHEGKWELEEGVPVKMESPSIAHQWISSEITLAFKQFLKGHKCRGLPDIDVWVGRLPFDAAARKNKASVRRPDFLVYCDKKQEYNNVILSPQLVIEIWSPTNTFQERNKKIVEYYRIGVKEFWQIDCQEQAFSIFSFADGNLRFLSDGTFHEPLESEYFPGLKVDLSEYYNEFG